ncbi:MAG TPA: aldo/keto reductase [Dermatophilaceae bacterium]|nr:aldo/keto reductase [Dermatophilaceae bacterium]
MTPTLALSHGGPVPQLGLGTWPMDDDEAARVIPLAVECGWRLVDTAAKYGNERGVGRGIRACGLPRAELFVTTKLDGGYQGDGKAVQGLDSCLDRLGLDYVDLLLIHWPQPWRDRYVDTWRTFERLLEDGRTRAIGVSNFKPAHLDRLVSETGTVPAVNQIQLSPYTPRRESRVANQRHGVVTQSWSPLGRGSDLLREPAVAAIADELGTTPGQVVLRWHVQQGLAAVPKSSDRTRLRQNLDVFGFELSPTQLARLDTLDRGESAAVDSDTSGH